MRKHVMAITYQPKIEQVKDGRCTQTIRKGRRVSEGDEILFHGWGEGIGVSVFIPKKNIN